MPAVLLSSYRPRPVDFLIPETVKIAADATRGRHTTGAGPSSTFPEWVRG